MLDKAGWKMKLYDELISLIFNVIRREVKDVWIFRKLLSVFRFRFVWSVREAFSFFASEKNFPNESYVTDKKRFQLFPTFPESIFPTFPFGKKWK